MSDKETLLSMGFDAERVDCEWASLSGVGSWYSSCHLLRPLYHHMGA